MINFTLLCSDIRSIFPPFLLSSFDLEGAGIRGTGPQ